jgi:hypothetical protein
MARRIRLASVLGLLMAVALSAPAFAGGWAQAQLDAGTPPGEEGGTTEVGFTLLQHGVTPVDWGSVTVIAVNAASGETVTASARSDGGDHWTASLAFPSTGEWTITILHDQLEVSPKNLPLTAGVAAPGAGGAAAGTAAETSTGLVFALVGFVVLVIVAGGAALFLSMRRRDAGSGPAAGAQPMR